MRLFDELGVVLFDAAMGTALMAAGQPKGVGSEEMNNIAPETVMNIHLENIRAGSDVVTSNTFGITQVMMRGDRDGALETLRKAVSLTKTAAAAGEAPCVRKIHTCLCVGPSGALLGPFGDKSYEEAEELYAAQAEAGAQAGVDFVFLETFPDLEEFAHAARVVKKASGLPVCGTMTFEKNGRSFMGASPEGLIDVARAEKLSATGANCTLDPAEILPVIEKLISLADGLPIIAQPNAGKPVYSDGAIVYQTSAEAFVRDAVKLLDAGVSGIGGCCGTNPSIISAIRDIIDRRQKAHDK